MRKNCHAKFILGLFLLLCWQGSRATHYSVNTLYGNWQGSLAWALSQANNDTSATLANPHIIDIKVGGEAELYPLPQRHCIINGPRDMSLKLAGVNYKSNIRQTGIHITLNYVVFDKTNYNADYGSALLAGGGAIFSLNYCLFLNNAARFQGAAVFCDGDTVYLTGCSFKNNCTTLSNGGGGAAIFNNGGYMLLSNCTFSGNTSVAVNGAGGAVKNCGEMDVINCRFYNNRSANDGGGLFNSKGAVCRISGSVFTNNNAANKGNDLDGEFLYLNAQSTALTCQDINQFIIITCDEQVEATEVYSVVGERIVFLKGQITKVNTAPLAQDLEAKFF